jgi:hypothetical protein
MYMEETMNPDTLQLVYNDKKKGTEGVLTMYLWLAGMENRLSLECQNFLNSKLNTFIIHNL